MTLRKANDFDSLGILRNEDELNEIFEDVETIYNEIHHLLCDEQYRKDKQTVLKRSVISEEEFEKKLCDILNDKDKSNFDLERINTSATLMVYKEKIRERDIMTAIARKKNFCLIIEFPVMFIKFFLLKGYETFKEKVLIKIVEKKND